MITILGARRKNKGVKDIFDRSREFCEKKDIEIQLFNAKMVFGRDHLLSAYEHASRAFERKQNKSNTILMETLLYASGERQIDCAIEKMGVKSNDREMGIVVIGDCGIGELLDYLGLERDDSVLECDPHQLKQFGITPREKKSVDREKVCDLVLEKVAMLDVKK